MMENNKAGDIIRTLRLEQKLTQKQLASELNISDKTVSKWERGLGLPDILLMPKLSGLLGIDMESLLTGDMTPNDFVGGNMKNIRYFICPACGNITLCTGAAEVSCCGRKLSAQTPQKAREEEKLTVDTLEDEWYITSSHPMNKNNYISFVALAAGDRVQMVKQYPEWNLNVRIPRRGHGMLLWYSADMGLLYQLI